jgi:hypothetical protein
MKVEVVRYKNLKRKQQKFHARERDKLKGEM